MSRREFIGTAGLVLVGDVCGPEGGRKVLLLHGGGQTRHAWDEAAVAFAAGGAQVVTLDLRGHGESAWAENGDYGLDAFAGDVGAVTQAMGGDVVVVGASLGGLAALLHTGERRGAFVRALVLVDITPRIETAGVARIVSFMLSRPDGFASVAEAALAVAAYNQTRERPSDVRGLERNLRRGADGRYRWHWDPRFLVGGGAARPHEAEARFTAAARALAVPTMLVRGLESDVVGDEGVASFRAAVPHAELVDVAHAGHMVAGDRNAAFTAAVGAFLARLG
jgi:non-heme chloroperoxidase